MTPTPYSDYPALAAEFLEKVAPQQRTLIAYAVKKCGCPERGYDLYMDTLLKCHASIAQRGFRDGSFVAYMVEAISRNFLYAKRQEKNCRLVPLERAGLEDGGWLHEECVDSHAHVPARRNRRSVMGYCQGSEDLEWEAAKATVAGNMRAWLVAHYSADEVAVFDLHLHGISLTEIAFLTPLGRYQAFRRIRRIKKDLLQTFKLSFCHNG